MSISAAEQTPVPISLSKRFQNCVSGIVLDFMVGVVQVLMVLFSINEFAFNGVVTCTTLAPTIKKLSTNVLQGMVIIYS
jgi:hypothetical protein